MIRVIDNFLPIQLLHPLEILMRRTEFSFGWKSNERLGNFGHWNHDFMSEKELGRGNIDGQEYVRTEPDLGRYVAHLERVVNAQLDIHRCYTNAYTYGTDGMPHTDEVGNRGGHLTALLYMVDRWKPEWAGATAVWNEDASDVEVVALPRRNRVVIFPSHRLHVGWGVSRACPILRQVFVMKVMPRVSI